MSYNDDVVKTSHTPGVTSRQVNSFPIEGRGFKVPNTQSQAVFLPSNSPCPSYPVHELGSPIVRLGALKAPTVLLAVAGILIVVELLCLGVSP